MAEKQKLTTRTSKATHEEKTEAKQKSVANAAADKNKTSATKTASTSSKSTKTSTARFSDRRKQKEGDRSIGRALIFIVVIIILGIGLTVFVQDFVSRQQQQEEQEAENLPQNEEQVQLIPNTKIGTTVLDDASAEKLTNDDFYTTKELQLGSQANTTAETQIEQLDHEVYTSFTRTSWDFSGVSNGLPQTTVSQNEDNDKEVSIIFQDVGIVTEEMLQEIAVDLGNVTKITGEKLDENTDIRFTLSLEEDSKYYAFMSNSGQTVNLDVKTVTSLNGKSTSSDVEIEEESSTTSSDAADSQEQMPESSSSSESSIAVDSGETNYDNEESKDKQEINSSMQYQNAMMNNYYYEDFGPYMEFSWVFQGGEQSDLPDATAQIIQEEGTYYIEVVMTKIQQDLFAARGWSQADFGGLSLKYSNLKAVNFISYQDGTSTYRVRLGGESDYRLYATELYEGDRMLTVRVFD